MHRNWSIVAATISFVLHAGQIYAWNAAGHKLISSIGYLQLSPSERQKIVSILHHHPRFEEDFKKVLPTDVEDADEWLFQQAAIWPDLVKQLPQPLKAQFDRPNWHYICKPVYLTRDDQAALEGNSAVNLKLIPPDKPTTEMNVIQTIRFARRMLKSDLSSQDDKALFLTWLIHDVAEIHQPLNSAMLYSAALFPRGDRGQNAIMTDGHGSLRHFWAGLLGSSTHFRVVHDKAAALVNDERYDEIKSMAPFTIDEQIWLDEGYQCATDICYLREVKEQLTLDPAAGTVAPIKLSEDYYVKLAHQTANRCAIDAGYRLGAILKEIAKTRL